ncbi:outer membrane protein assembly factor BamE [Loktanella sp. SALINAS62]|uniref:outer membrane protein assembly factor BamE n=1 Tax=Loktanella sp. SALINAS62 TaxID=2706124 RepID=UPI001B8C45B6|nr:outer membrane protein assembly factor BamE [Loktanella sp. SALINAS62]MBS1304157.1 outer membrane protein assembly factor BamE [Loktanella sp. SALINAS62]
MTTTFHHRKVLTLVAGAGLALSVACTPIVRNHGYIPVPDALALLTIGQDTRESVIAAVGPPVTSGVLSDDALYYVQSRFSTFGAAAPVETNREVLAISFTSNGTLENIERFGLEDGRVVTLSRRVTSDNVRDSTFLRQLLGSVGRVTTADLVGQPDG